MSRALEHLKALVAIDSTSTRTNVPVVDYLEQAARAMGFTSERMRWRDNAGVEKQNLLARRGSGEGGLALVGHSDCVPFDAGWREALTPEIRDGMLYGRGSADTKSFISASLAAAEAAPIGAKPLHLIFTADEELGCLGAKRLQEAAPVKPRYAIIGEPTSLTPIRAHKGYCLAEVEITGVEGHSAYPEVGASAVLAAAAFIREIDSIFSELARAEQDEFYAPPYTTYNVGMIQGGKAKNIIPGHCKLTLEWRPIPRQDPALALHRMESAARSIAGGSGGKIKIAINSSRLEGGVATPRTAEIVRFLEAESGKQAESVAFGTELPELTEMGVEACVFGPGDIRVAHRTGEHVPLEELERATAVLGRAIAHFCV